MRDLLLLHGAIGAKDQFESLKNALGDQYKIHTLNFSGHGGEPLQNEFSIQNFAGEVLQFLDTHSIEKVDIFGYSMGGYVALYLAKWHPKRVGRIFTLATKFHWTPEIAQRETKMLDADKIAEKVPAFAAQLEKRHAPNDWKLVMQQTARMMIGLGADNPLQGEDYASIAIPVRISIGDKDQMVTLEETIGVYRQLPDATFIVFPNTQHPIEKVDVQRLAAELRLFFN